MINWNRLSQRVFGIVRGAGHQVEIYDAEGTAVSDPAQARRFFVAQPNYMVTVDQDQRRVQISRNQNTQLRELTDVMRMLRNLRREFGIKVGVRVFGQAIKPKHTAYQAQIQRDRSAEEMLESALTGRRKTSYQHFDNGVTLVIKHRTSVDPDRPATRSRNIQRMLVKTPDGTHTLPFCDLTAARAVAQHCAHGGSCDDAVADRISQIAQQCAVLRDFVRMNQHSHSQHQPLTQSAAKQQIRDLRHCLRQASTKSGIVQFQQQPPAMVSGSTVQPELTHSYTHTHMDPRAQAALPVVAELVEQRRQRLLQASQQPVRIAPPPVRESDIMIYEQPHKNLAHRLQRILNSMEPSELQDHLQLVAHRVQNQQPISEFDRQLVINTLDNMEIT